MSSQALGNGAATAAGRDDVIQYGARALPAAAFSLFPLTVRGTSPQPIVCVSIEERPSSLRMRGI